MTIKLQMLPTIPATELFANLPVKIQNELWDNCPFSFGDCSHSLVTAYDVESWIDTLTEEEDYEHPEVVSVKKQLASHYEEVYIDLEN